MSFETEGEALATSGPQRAGARVVARASGYNDFSDEEHPTLKV